MPSQKNENRQKTNNMNPAKTLGMGAFDIRIFKLDNLKIMRLIWTPT